MGRINRLLTWDTETTGLSPATDQVIQVAGMAVDKDLNYIKGDQIVLDIKLRLDVVPNPYAFATHGISILGLIENGITEFEAAGHLKQWFRAEKNTMITGYNTRKFDDEVARNLFFRTMLDCYDHEWADGNSRSDIMQLTMLAYALRPEVINWPVKPDGGISMKLGDMARENGIDLTHAHDARFDCIATVELMRKLKAGNEKLWDYFLQLSDKKFVAAKLNARQPLVIVDRYIPRELGSVSMMLPVIEDKLQAGKMHCIDLREDPSEILRLSAEELRRRIFTPMAELKEGESIKSVRSMASNQAPLIADPLVFKGRGDLIERAGLDLAQCQKHAEMIAADPEFRARLQQAMVSEFPLPTDIYQGIYSSGMIFDGEKNLRGRQRVLTVEGPGQVILPAIVKVDPYELCKQQSKDRLRLFELALRAKWANFTDEVLAMKTFTAPELKEWVDHLERTWFGEPKGKQQINIDSYKLTLSEVRAKFALTDVQEKALVELEAHIETSLKTIDTLKQLSADMTKAAEERLDGAATPNNAGVVEKDRQNRADRHGQTSVNYQPG